MMALTTRESIISGDLEQRLAIGREGESAYWRSMKMYDPTLQLVNAPKL